MSLKRRPFRKISRLSPRGQITVPKPVRDHLGLSAGSAVEFTITDAGAVVVQKQPDSVPPLRGILNAYGRNPALSIAEIDEEIGREVARLDASARSANADDQ